MLKFLLILSLSKDCKSHTPEVSSTWPVSYSPFASSYSRVATPDLQRCQYVVHMSPLSGFVFHGMCRRHSRNLQIRCYKIERLRGFDILSFKTPIINRAGPPSDAARAVCQSESDQKNETSPSTTTAADFWYWMREIWRSFRGFRFFKFRENCGGPCV